MPLLLAAFSVVFVGIPQATHAYAHPTIGESHLDALGVSLENEDVLKTRIYIGKTKDIGLKDVLKIVERQANIVIQAESIKDFNFSELTFDGADVESVLDVLGRYASFKWQKEGSNKIILSPA